MGLTAPRTANVKWRRRYRLLRERRKPHVFFEDGEWSQIEYTAPGEWWQTPVDFQRG